MSFSLDDLTDEQKSLLSQLSYLDFDMEEYQKAKEANPNLKLSDMGDMLSNPNESYLGNMTGSKNATSTKFILNHIAGESTTEQEFYQKLIDAGLGDLQIKDIEYDKQSGFDAICFEDNSGNTGFSFRGTDLSSLKDAGIDVQEYLTNSSSQHELAQEFFDRNKANDSSNYVYGHSLGGNLSEHVYLNNYEDISETFVMNATPIDERLFVTQGQIDAFNDPDKFKCNIIDGDPVSQLKDDSLYRGNVRYIKNNDRLNDNALADHLVESAEIAEDGSFVEMPEEETYSGFRKLTKMFGNSLGKLGDFIKNTAASIKNLFVGKEETPLLNSGEYGASIASLYRESLNVMSWISPNYTLEQAERAIAYSENPLKFVSLRSTDRENDDLSIVDDEKVPWENGRF